MSTDAERERDERGVMSEDSGWYEAQQETPDGKKKAPDHVIASNKAQIAAQNNLTVPMVKENTVHTDSTTTPAGWLAETNGFHFRKEVAEEHTAETFTTSILHGSIKGNHGTLVLWVYSKDIGELQELQEKAGILESKLASYTVADPSFVTISRNLHDVLFKIRKLKKDLAPKVSSETKLEETFHDTGFEQDRKTRYQNWCTKFMEKANEESERIDAEINKKDPTREAET